MIADGAGRLGVHSEQAVGAVRGAARFLADVERRAKQVGIVQESSALAFFCSRAQVFLAPSICLRFAMHAFFCEASRALMKLGMAIAASKPMIATTIMISTNVNALRREVLICIC